MRRFAAISALLVCAAGASVASATAISTFDNPFALTARYGSWAPGPNSTAVITSNPDNYQVKATGYGSGYKSIFPSVVDASGANTIQLDATVNAGVAGFVVAVGDGEGNEFQWAWYGNTTSSGNETTGAPVHYLLTMPISAGSQTLYSDPAVPFDLSQIVEFHIGVDPGGFPTTPYDVQFNDLSFISTPEPASLAAGALAFTLIGRRRR